MHTLRKLPVIAPMIKIKMPNKVIKIHDLRFSKDFLIIFLIRSSNSTSDQCQKARTP